MATLDRVGHPGWDGDHADANGRDQRLASFLEGLLHAGDDCGGDALADPRIGDVAHEEGEFVASKSGGQVVGTHGSLNAVGDFLEQSVTKLVTMRIVNTLEVVDVDQQDCEAMRALNGDGYILLKSGAVGQTSQEVVVGQVFNPLLGLPPFGDVGVGADDAALRQRNAADFQDSPVGAVTLIQFWLS